MIRKIVHEGLDAVEIRDDVIRVVVVAEVGPRIAWYGPADGDNLLFWDRSGERRRGPWSLRGGHRLWLTRPGADETEETYGCDDRRCEVRQAPGGVTVSAPADAQQLVRSLRLRLAPDGLTVDHGLRNVGTMLWSGGAWGLTCTAPRRGTSYGIPFGEPSAWDVVHLMIPRRWGGDHTARVADPQIVVREHGLVVRPRGVESKRMIRTSVGVMGMTNPAAGISFLKRSQLDDYGIYPLGTNLAFYIAPGNFMVEMESMGPQRTLRPGQSLTHREHWSLQPAIDWSDADAVATAIADPRRGR